MCEVLTESGCAFSIGSDDIEWITCDCNFVALILLKRSFWYSRMKHCTDYFTVGFFLC